MQIPRQHMTEAEYLAFERDAERKHDFVDGQIVAMAGATARHNHVVANVIRALGKRLSAGTCWTFGSDQRVRVDANGTYLYPDLSGLCGTPELHGARPRSLANPSLVVEVLSDSTERYDRGQKFARLQQLASLHEYVLVAAFDGEPYRLERFERDPAGGWHYTSHDDGVVRMLGVDVAVTEVFEGAAALPDE